jgi:hypothetical protein
MNENGLLYGHLVVEEVDRINSGIKKISQKENFLLEYACSLLSVRAQYFSQFVDVGLLVILQLGA